ncbi:hypothetical protein GCM10027298_37970 [Epidermidibacterium keratini]
MFAVLAVAGCTTGPSQSAESSSGGETTQQSSSQAPATTTQQAQTASAEEPCPYLDIDFMSETVGQQLSTSTVTTITPPPGPGPKCEFTRPNGEIAATVDTLAAADPATAQQTALDFAPGGNPVKAGEGGSVLVKKGEDLTQLAAYQGTLVVFVTINQESSLEATTIAETALAALA